MRQPIATASLQQLTNSLAVVVAEGLPVIEETTAGILLDLRSVYARAVIPDEPRSRLAALNVLLPRLVATIADGTYRDAVQILFGLAPGTRGTTLTARHRQAATGLGYSAGHFRNQKEAELLQAVAVGLHDDLLRYRSRVDRASESMEPTGDSPRVGPEHITHEEELISRVWQHVYGLRAEMIAVARLSSEAGYESQAEEHRQAAQCQNDTLRELLSEYVATYGQRLIQHGDTEYSVEAVERLGHWSV